MNTDSTHSIEGARFAKSAARGRLPAALLLGTLIAAANPAARLQATSLGAPFAPYYTLNEIATTGFPGFGCPFFAPQSTGMLLLLTDKAYAISVARDPDGHVDAINGGVEQNFDDGMIDPGAYSVAVAPNGALFVLGYLTENDFGIAELKPGQSAPAFSTTLSSPQLPGSNYGFLGIAPASMGGGGNLKFLRSGTWFDLTMTGPEATGPNAGLYSLGSLAGSVSLDVNPTGGQMAFVPAGTPGFTSNAVLFPDDSNGIHSVVAYDLDSHANPVPATRRDFLVETDPFASPIQGIIVDPLTGDLLFISGETHHLTVVRKRPVAGPVVTVTSPESGAVLPEGIVTVTATVSGGSAATSYVRFYEQGTTEGFAQSTAAPFSGVAKDLAPGLHTVFARATDVNGQTTESPHITFTVAQSPRLRISRLKAGGVRLVLADAVNGTRYALETRDAVALNLGIGIEDKWVRSNEKIAANGEVIWDFPDIDGVERVYRAISVEP